MARQSAQVSEAGEAIGETSKQKPIVKGCVEVYGINLKSSEYYVREMGPRPKNGPELSSVVSGMVRNTCQQRLKTVSLLIKVQDEKGKRGSAWASVANVEVGQAKAFERAWIGKLASYEIAQIK